LKINKLNLDLADSPYTAELLVARQVLEPVNSQA